MILSKFLDTVKSIKESIFKFINLLWYGERHEYSIVRENENTLDIEESMPIKYRFNDEETAREISSESDKESIGEHYPLTNSVYNGENSDINRSSYNGTILKSPVNYDNSHEFQEESE